MSESIQSSHEGQAHYVIYSKWLLMTLVDLFSDGKYITWWRYKRGRSSHLTCLKSVIMFQWWDVRSSAVSWHLERRLWSAWWKWNDPLIKQCRYICHEKTALCNRNAWTAATAANYRRVRMDENVIFGYSEFTSKRRIRKQIHFLLRQRQVKFSRPEMESHKKKVQLRKVQADWNRGASVRSTGQTIFYHPFLLSLRRLTVKYTEQPHQNSTKGIPLCVSWSK